MNLTTWYSWKWLKESVYSLTLEYEAGGVDKALLENMIIRLDFPSQKLSCHIYTIPLVTQTHWFHTLCLSLAQNPFTIQHRRGPGSFTHVSEDLAD